MLPKPALPLRRRTAHHRPCPRLALALLAAATLAACGGDGPFPAGVVDTPAGNSATSAATTASTPFASASASDSDSDSAVAFAAHRAADAAPAAKPAARTGRRESADFSHAGPWAAWGPGEAPGALAEAVDRYAEAADPAAVPVDPLARTRAGRYLGRATAERLDDAARGGIVWVDASCCAGLASDLPERIAFGMLAVQGDDAAVFVTGRDLRAAARLADRLEAFGLRHVHLVTP